MIRKNPITSCNTHADPSGVTLLVASLLLSPSSAFPCRHGASRDAFRSSRGAESESDRRLLDLRQVCREWQPGLLARKPFKYTRETRPGSPAGARTLKKSALLTSLVEGDRRK